MLEKVVRSLPIVNDWLYEVYRTPEVREVKLEPSLRDYAKYAHNPYTKMVNNLTEAGIEQDFETIIKVFGFQDSAQWAAIADRMHLAEQAYVRSLKGFSTLKSQVSKNSDYKDIDNINSSDFDSISEEEKQMVAKYIDPLFNISQKKLTKFERLEK